VTSADDLAALTDVGDEDDDDVSWE